MSKQDNCDCSKQDNCDCKNIRSLESLPWSNKHSRTFKQLHIARSPKILCLNLQRASINVFGESIKLQGHISFPLNLNTSPFQNKGVEIKHTEQNLPIRYSDFLRLQKDSHPLSNLYKQEIKSTLTVDVETKQPSSEVHSDVEIQEEQTQDFHTTTLQDKKVHETLDVTQNGHHMYNLVSVVEHFGNTGGGHYTVYRRVCNKIKKNNEIDAKWSHVKVMMCIGLGYQIAMFVRCLKKMFFLQGLACFSMKGFQKVDSLIIEKMSWF